MPDQQLPLPKERVQQFIVQFACRTPTRKEISSAERKALKDVLRTSTTELFQLFEDEISESSPHLFQAARQYVVESLTVTVPSLIISHNSITLLHPVKLGPRTFTDNRGFDTSHLNETMRNVLVDIQNTLSRVSFNRAGKIFEIVLGPFGAEDKKSLFDGVVSYNLDDVGEVSLVFSPYRQIEGETFNLRTEVSYQQQNLEDRFTVGIRVDINNRQLRDSLEPTQIMQIWGQADRLIADHLRTILRIPGVT